MPDMRYQRSFTPTQGTRTQSHLQVAHIRRIFITMPVWYWEPTCKGHPKWLCIRSNVQDKTRYRWAEQIFITKPTSNKETKSWKDWNKTWTVMAWMREQPLPMGQKVTSGLWKCNKNNLHNSHTIAYSTSHITHMNYKNNTFTSDTHPPYINSFTTT